MQKFARIAEISTEVR